METWEWVAIGVGIALLVLVVWWRVPAWSWVPVLAVATLLYLPFVPWVFRCSRVLWIHLDRAVDPE